MINHWFEIFLVQTLVRQCNVLIILTLEKYIYDIIISSLVRSTVTAMVEGAVITAIGELSSWKDYEYIFIVVFSNSFLAAHLFLLQTMLDLKSIDMCVLLY